MTSANQAGGLPLEGLKILDFSQFLAGPSCALRLADLGADVIKIERPGVGDLCRTLAVADQWVGQDSLLFHTINRNKGSVAADLKDAGDLEAVKAMIADADVAIHNFRPGVMERIGLGYEAVAEINPRVIYGVVSGYGTDGVWRDKPGQDLLVQARSGLTWLTGSAGMDPVPMGISITDISAGAHLTQGILAALVRRSVSGKGALVEVSLLASAMDIQFEQVTSYLNGPQEQPKRSGVNGANVHSTAPYGLYQTADGYMALAMSPIATLRDLLGIKALEPFADGSLAYSRRDEIKQILKDHLVSETTEHWLGLLESAGIWAAEVLDWPELEETGALESLGVVQSVKGPEGETLRTTTCPIRIDGRVLSSNRGAPPLGRDTATHSDISQKKSMEGATG